MPYAAVTRFFDPHVQFGLQFEPPPVDIEPVGLDEPAEPARANSIDDGPVVELRAQPSSARNEAPLSDVAAEEPRSLTDEAILARFTNAKRRPPGSELLGFRMVRVNQSRPRGRGGLRGDRAADQPDEADPWRLSLRHAG